MQTEQLIPADVFCVNYNVELTFINSLQESGLVQIEIVNETPFIYVEELPKLEKIVRLHYDLEINVQGIETIIHLLEQIEKTRNEVMQLKNRLSMYEMNE